METGTHAANRSVRHRINAHRHVYVRIYNVQTILRIQNIGTRTAVGKGASLNKRWWEQESVNIYVNCANKKGKMKSQKLHTQNNQTHYDATDFRLTLCQNAVPLKFGAPHNFPRATSWLCAFSLRMTPTNQITYFTQWILHNKSAQPKKYALSFLIAAIWYMTPDNIK